MTRSRAVRLSATLTAAVAAGVALCQPGAALAAPTEFDAQAHRGGRGEYTEESLVAFDHALSVGVSTLEFDVVLTKDNQPIVWHDPTIMDTKCADTAPLTAGDPQFPYVGKLVHDLTYAQIQTLDCGKLLEGFPTANVVEGNTIALLPEVLALATSRSDSVRFNIETKIEAEHPEQSASVEDFVNIILAATNAAGVTGRTTIQSFDWRTLAYSKLVAPSVTTVALWDETTWIENSKWLGDETFEKHGGDVIAAALALGAGVLSPGYSLPYGGVPADPDFHLVADAAFIAKAHAAGLTVIPWTINDATAMQAQIDAGADGIITDYPTLLRKVLQDNQIPVADPA